MHLMDSVNSGSLQSSSGGEADDFVANTPDSLSAIAAQLIPPPQPSPPRPLCSSRANDELFFDPISYLASISSTASTWPRRPPDPAADSPIPPLPVQSPDPLAPATSDAAPRSSKKRSRASRRAQTTVLTTDTSNFRAMVQQFTGIPSPPFDLATATSPSPLARSRFNLLFRSNAAFASSPLPPPPSSFLLRPFSLKPQICTLTTNSTGVTTPAIYSTTIADLNTITSAKIPTSTSTTNQNQNLSSADLGVVIGRQSLQSLLQEIPAVLFGSTKQNSITSEAGSSNLEMGSCNLNYPAPGSAERFNAEKGAQIGARVPRSEEDAMDAWINFSSD